MSYRGHNIMHILMFEENNFYFSAIENRLIAYKIIRIIINGVSILVQFLSF